jgi:hypothetical protein
MGIGGLSVLIAVILYIYDMKNGEALNKTSAQKNQRRSSIKRSFGNR